MTPLPIPFPPDNLSQVNIQQEGFTIYDAQLRPVQITSKRQLPNGTHVRLICTIGAKRVKLASAAPKVKLEVEIVQVVIVK